MHRTWTLQDMILQGPSSNVQQPDLFVGAIRSDWMYAFAAAWRVYDLHPHPRFWADIKRIIAADEGDSDTKDWLCVYETRDGRLAKMFACCTHMGWNVSCNGSCAFYATLPECLFNLTDSETRRLLPDLLSLLAFDRNWLTPLVLTAIESVTQDELPQLSDVLEDLGAQEETTKWLRARNLWVIEALKEIKFQAGLEAINSILGHLNREPRIFKPGIRYFAPEQE